MLRLTRHMTTISWTAATVSRELGRLTGLGAVLAQRVCEYGAAGPDVALASQGEEGPRAGCSTRP